ncbi:hypothetical protein EP232_03070 [bacterium]|nr:MAG: hypothetical protein EP232_03070 [bacterium]
MNDPLFYILAPFALTFGLFVVYLVVSIFLGDPARPFRMFAAGLIPRSTKEADMILSRLEQGSVSGAERNDLINRLDEILSSVGQGEEWDEVRSRARPYLNSGR